MPGWIQRYTRWLHTQWPAGHVEQLPELQDDLGTSVRGVYVVGDLTGIPLLKFSADSGARAVRAIVADPAFARERKAKAPEVLDLLIVGAGVGGMASALEASKHGLDFAVYESKRRLQTVADFPKGKPIYTYPTDFEPAGEMRFRADVKEDLLAELHEQTDHIDVREGHVASLRRRGGLLEVGLEDGPTLRALRVIVAIGRSGSFRRLDVPGEDLDTVYNRLHDPADFRGQSALVVGGGDSALETAIALVQCGGDVTLSYRGEQLSRPKPESLEQLRALESDPSTEVAVEDPVSERVTTATGRFLGAGRHPGRLRIALGTRVREIRDREVVLESRDGARETLPNDVVFSMIGREAPLDFLRRAGIKLRGETRGSDRLLPWRRPSGR